MTKKWFLLSALLGLTLPLQAQDAAPAGKTHHKTYILFKADLKWGSGGSEDGMFNDPIDIGVDGSDYIWVLDRGNRRVEKFDGDGKFVLSRTKFEVPDPDNNSGLDWQYLQSFAVDKDGNLFLRSSGEYAGYTPDGKYIFWHNADASNAAGYSVGPAGYLYAVTNSQGGNIYKETRNGKLLVEYPAISDYPAGIAVDSLGNFYIVNNGFTSVKNSFCVQKYSPTGDYLIKWEKNGERDGEFSGTTGVGTDSEDHLYVVDGPLDRVQVFTTDGKLWSKFGHEGIGLGELRNPRGVAVNSHGQVYVVDAGNHRIQRFSRFKVDEVYDDGGKLLSKTETPLTDALAPSKSAYAADSFDASQIGSQPQAADQADKDALKARAQGQNQPTPANGGGDDVGKAAGDAAKKILGF